MDRVECLGWAGGIFGHKYVNVYNEQRDAPNFRGATSISGYINPTEFCETKKTYVHTICLRCGHTIKECQQ